MENLAFFMVERGFGMNLIRNIFGMLDSVAFFLFAKVMEVMFEIADVTSKANLSEFLGPLQSRIYVILSIYMLFKVTISLITYVVNPDAMTDKSQGIGKLVQRIVISLILLIFFPYAFSFLNTFQSHIISNNTIPKLVLGSGGSYSDAAGIGNEIAYSVYNGTFIYAGDPGSKVESDSATVESVVEHINDPGSDKSEYANGYLPFAGFAVGLVLTILTLSMCVDVAMRVFKLMILQLVAPIPILSYIDPKSSKDGAFSKWLKMTVQVWLEVFLRLFTIYFILLVIERLINAGGLLFDGNNLFVKIALIIGLLFFAKDAPKFIYDALGIKAPERGMFAGMGNILAAGAIGAGAVSGAITGFEASRLADTANEKKHGFLNTAKNVGAGLFGGVTGIGAGYGAATKAKDHNARAVMEAMNKRNNLALSRGKAGSTVGGRLLAGVQTSFGLSTSFDKMDAKVKDYESAESAWKRIGAAMNSDDNKFYSFGSDFKSSSGETLIKAGQNYSTKGMNDLLDRMKSSGQYTQSDIESVDGMLKEVQKAKFDNVRSVSDPDTLSGTESQIFSGAQTIFEVGTKYANDDDKVFEQFKGITSVSDTSLSMGKDFKGASFNAKRESEKIKNSAKYNKASADKSEAQKK